MIGLQIAEKNIEVAIHQKSVTSTTHRRLHVRAVGEWGRSREVLQPGQLLKLNQLTVGVVEQKGECRTGMVGTRRN